MQKYGLTDRGPNIKRLDVILAEMQESMTKKLGVNVGQNTQSFLNHLLTNAADRIAELWEFGEEVYYSQYPSSATGVSLDNAAQFGGSTREMPAKSYFHILCTGQDGTVIPAGTLIATDTSPATSLTLPSDSVITRAAFNKAAVILASPGATAALGVALNGTLYTITPDATKSVSENLAALGAAIKDTGFTTSVVGDTLHIEAVDSASSNVMVLSENLTTASVGSVITFATVDVGDYIAGQLAETDVEFRRSYADKIYNRSSSMLESIKSAILENVQGILSVATYENDGNVTDSMGRWPHCIEVVVDGGDKTDIAQQILAKKSGGISSFGSEEVTLPGEYGEPIVVRFNRPTYIKVWFKVGVTLSQNTNPPTNYAELIKNQILEKVESLSSGESVIPQKFNLQVSGIDYIDVWMFSTTDDGKTPSASEYTKRSVSISPRERAVTDENRSGVVIDA